MDFTLAELKTPGPGKGVPVAPDIDVRRYLVRQVEATRPPPPPQKKPWWVWN